MREEDRLAVASAIRAFVVGAGRARQRQEPGRKPNTIALVTDAAARELVLAYGFVPRAPVVEEALEPVARFSEDPAFAPVRARLPEDGEELARLAALALLVTRRSGALDELGPGYPLELLALKHGEAFAAAKQRAREVEDEVDAAEEADFEDEDDDG